MATAAVDLIQDVLPNLDLDIIDYVGGYLRDSIEDEEDGVENFVRPLLESEHVDPTQVEELCSKITEILMAKAGPSAGNSKGPARLDQVVDMRRLAAMSKTGQMGQAVDIESTTRARETRVDVKKLEKQEAKIKAKLEKKTARYVQYEGSKLVDAAKQQREYEKLYMEVNPLESQDKGKSKDIHLEAIDVNFGSLKILSNASLTLAAGRRYGLVGRNGVGKSTLLRHIAMREVPIPTHISILYVEQEVHGDDTPALQAVLQADVWRERLLAEESELNATLAAIEKQYPQTAAQEGAGAGEATMPSEAKRQKEDALSRLSEVHKHLIDIDAETGPSRAAELLAGLGFTREDQDKPTRQFSGGWRMRISLARALFVRPDLLMLDEPSNNLDLNALAWLEDYLQTWPYTLLVVSHDRAFLDAVATDIVHQHSERLDYYKGKADRNFTQFYATKSERAKNQKREYENQMQYRAHLQAFIDRWRYNANRAAQAQSKIKILEKLPDLEPPEEDDVVKFRFAETDKISPPLLQLDNVTFGYTKEKIILNHVNVAVDADSRLGIIGPNGAGKSTLLKLLIGELQPLSGQMNRNGRLRISYFAQHHIDQLDLSMSPVQWLAHKFPGQVEQEYRQHLGAFGITGMTGLQKLATLSGGQKSRVAFATLSLARPHILILDEPTNHLDTEICPIPQYPPDALMKALQDWNGGVILISHDERFINTVCKDLWVCADGKAEKFYGDVSEYKRIIVTNQKLKPT